MGGARGDITLHLETLEESDTQRNLRKNIASSVAFGCILAGGAVALAGVAIGTWAEIHHRSSTKGEAIAKFSLVLLGGVIAGFGAFLSFAKGFGENEGDEKWLRSWVPPRRCAAGAMHVASELGLALPTNTRIRKKVEVAALMYAWGELVSRDGTVEKDDLQDMALSIMVNELSMGTYIGQRNLERSLENYLDDLGGLEPSIIYREELVSYHAVRLLWKAFFPSDEGVPTTRFSARRLREIGLTTQAATQSLVMERLKLFKVFPEVPDEARRKVDIDQGLYLPGGGTSRFLASDDFDDENEIP